MSCLPSRLLLLLCLAPALAAAATEEELFFKSVSEVNEGDLKFLDRPPERPVHHHSNHIFILDDSLTTGWIRLEQCHRHLDPVPSMQVVYSQDRIRGLTILRSEHIGKAWVLDHTVQMEQVEPDALICIRAESRALQNDGAGVYSLINGPYMRRFLDGYYPMRVSMDVTLETDRLRFLDMTPTPQPGFNFRQNDSQLGYEAVFEGQLRTRIRFSRKR